MKIFISTLAVITALTTASAQDLSQAARAQMVSVRAEKASRTAAQRKLDSQLLFLGRETRGLRAVEGAPNLKSRAKREKDGTVRVDISAAPSAELRQAITEAGGTVLYESTRWNSIHASLPPRALEALAGRADVKRIAPAATRTVHTGPVTNEADPAHRAGFARTNFMVNGTGLKIGVISDSSRHSANSIANGELPADFTVLPGRSGVNIGDGGEGTAMSEIIHDIAPGAKIFFANAGDNKAYMADSILMLRSNGCQIIVDDISFSDEWQFQDDILAQAINQVVADGAVYLSSAGNEGSHKQGNSTTWEGDFVDGGPGTAPLPQAGETVHNFGTQNYNRLTGTGNSGATLQWSDEYNTSANDYDLVILSADGTSILAMGNNLQIGSGTPFESVPEVHPGERIVIMRYSDQQARYLRLSTVGSKLEFQTAGQTIGHASTPNCITVAASDSFDAFNNQPAGFFTTNSPAEAFTSDGPRKFFHHPNGTPITPGNFLASGGTNHPSPNITAGDGGATSVPGFDRFYGTSAAAPAAAAIAALVWSRNPALGNSQVRAILEASCLDIDAPGFDIISGHGILRADIAVASALGVNNTPPILVAVVIGNNLDLSWPLDRIGWRLLSQTNNLAGGVSLNPNDWATVSGSAATNQVSVPISSALQGGFFRLTYP